MARHRLLLSSLILSFFALVMAGQQPAQTDSTAGSKGGPNAGAESGPLYYDATYRSASPRHKVIVQAGQDRAREAILAGGGTLVEDYGSFALYSLPGASAGVMSTMSAGGAQIRDDMNMILLRAGAFDTTAGERFEANLLGEAADSDEQLMLVQMVGPVKQRWLDDLGAAAEIVSYVPNNAYLVRVKKEALGQFNQLKAAEQSFIQWSGDYKPAYKIAPELSLASGGEITANIQLVTGAETERELQQIGASSVMLGGPETVLNYTNVRVRVPAGKVADIARLSGVVWIEPRLEYKLHDEKQGLIVSGNYTGNQLAIPSYLGWLRARGLDRTPDFLVDIADSGIDRGVLDPQIIHRDFLGTSGASRIVYSRFVGAVDQPISSNDTVGHGTINASIVGGYNLNQGFPYTDPERYSYGLGIHPFVRMGVTKIFAPDFTNPSYVDMLDAMYRDGTRVSNNSWGAITNAYTTDSQLYDSLVRDARRSETGNQEMTVVFSSGNSGAGRLSIPSNAKNVIAVGASENLRAGIDGCRVDSTGGDDIQSVIDFSSGGRTLDGRKKPEIVAPGTHVQGASSQDINYTGSGVCGPPNFPVGQTLYTWSSGTSHSAPAVAGAAALVRQFFQQSTGNPASPAMIKAFLTNSTNYMTGHRANDNLPGESQGWGLVNLGRAFDNVQRMLIDQTQVLTESGRTVTLRGRIADATKPFRVTLAWTDAPGSPLGNPVVNNIDLKVEVGGKIYFGNNFSGQFSVEGGAADNLNNVEAVWAPLATTGEFTITVTAANVAGDGVPGNTDVSDQDFALVVYNARAVDEGGGGGGGGGGGNPVDPPPTVSLRSPLGGERLTVGSMVRILWDASDDKKIENQRVEFSADGIEYNPIALLDGNARTFDWRIPAIPTPFARIKVTVFDGVNLPVSSSNNSAFEIVNGPPDNSPPQVLLLTPNKESIVGGGTTMRIEWRENDNVGVIQRIIELSTDNGDSFQQIISLIAPPSGETQNYTWQIPIDLATDKAKVRITLYDGAGNSATVTSSGKFEIWPMPIITEVDVKEDDETGKLELELSGRNFRDKQTEIYVDGKKLKKVKFEDKFSTGSGTFRKVSSFDKKVKKRVPWHEDVVIVVKLKETLQESPPFSFRRRRD